MAIEFDRDFSVTYGRVDQVSPLIRRVVAENPGRFTFTGTGTFIVGRGTVAVIDPGPLIPAHVDALLRAVEGETVSHIFITHTHGDHSPAAQPLKEATGAATYGFGPHPVADIEAGRGGASAGGAGAGSGEGAGGDHGGHQPGEQEPGDHGGHQPGEQEPGDHGGHHGGHQPGENGPGEEVAVEERSDVAFVPDVAMADGDVVHGGGDGAAWTIEALHTPGHISNHLCFALPQERALFTGDHVMGWSTSVIPSPDGNLGDYLRNLARLLDRDDEVYWPTHGPPIRQPHPFVRALIAHRQERTRQIVERLAAGDETTDQIVPVLYADVDPKLHPAAARSVLAHLVHLVETGEVVADHPAGENAPLDLSCRWRLARPER